MPPNQQLAGSSTAIKHFGIIGGMICRVEYAVIAQQNQQRQVAAQQVLHVVLNLIGVDLVDDIRQQHHQRSSSAMSR